MTALLWNNVPSRFITGLSYAYGDHSPEVRAAARTCRLIVCAYGAQLQGRNFSLQRIFCNGTLPAITPAPWTKPALTDAFLGAPGDTYPMLYYIWGDTAMNLSATHTWEQMESLCRRLAGRDDIWYVTNIDYYHLSAGRAPRLGIQRAGRSRSKSDRNKGLGLRQWPGPHSVKIPAAIHPVASRGGCDMSFLTVPTDGIATVFHATDKGPLRSRISVEQTAPAFDGAFATVQR